MFNFQLKDIIGKKDDDHQWGLDKDADLQALLKICKRNLKNVNEEKIKKAFVMSYNAHQNKLRKSGKPFYTHPLHVALILIEEIAIDDSTVIAALLHEVMDRGPRYKKNDIADEFGAEVARIVNGIHKIEHIESQDLTPIDQLENYRKLLLSLFQDFRIIFVKLADRLHNMRTVEFLSEKGQNKLARETLDVYAPFANRFGLRNIKWELEDLAFKVLNRKAYDEIKQKLNATREQREEYVNKLIQPLNDKLMNDNFIKKNKIKFKIYGRAKHIYSIYNKMRIRQKTLEELYDLTALRVTIDSDDPHICFYVYGLIASVFPPVPETFKDYINSPKKNGYQSIHTGVPGLKNRPIEIQIRTHKMHEQSEKGVSAHFRYKSGKVDTNSVMESEEISRWMSEIREIFENADQESSERLLENVKKNIFMDEIYVFTPKNEFRSLPRDATPIDFAFSIHSDIGFKYIGAKVNGRIVPMDYKLQSSDQVEILISENSEPDEEWMKIAVTAKAKSAINKFIRNKETQLIKLGKTLFKDILEKRGLSNDELSIDKLAEKMNVIDEDDFYKKIAKNQINIEKIFDFMKYKQNELKENYFTNGNGKRNKLSKNGNDNKLKYNILEIDGRYSTNLKIMGKDRPNLLNEITGSILESQFVNINGIEINNEDSKFESTIALDSQTKDDLEKLFKRIKFIRGIESIDTFQK